MAAFCDQSHLARVFRRLTGVSPEEYRRAAGQAAEAAITADAALPAPTGAALEARELLGTLRAN